MAHGYQPQRLLGVAVGMTLLGWGLFAAGDHAGTMIPTKAEAYTIYERTGQVPASYPAFCAWMYSLDTLVPIINFGQKDHWRPRDPRPASPAPKPSQLVVFASTSVLPSPRPMTTIGGSSGLFSHSERWSRIRAELIDPLSRPGVLRIYRWFHMGIGWLLITLGIAGVTGLVRKE